MNDLATLGLAVDSRQVTKGAQELDKLAQSAERAETAAEGLATGTEKANRASSGMYSQSTQLIRQMNAFEASLSRGADSMAELAVQRAELNDLQRKGMIDDAEALKINKQLDNSHKRLSQTLAKQENDFQRLMRKVDPARAALENLDRQIRELDAHADAGRISWEEYSTAVGKLEARRAGLDATSSSMQKLGLNTKTARGEMLTLGNALARGDFPVAARNLFELGSNAEMGAGKLALMLAPLAGVGAAVGALAVAWYQGSREQEAYTKAVVLSGNAAGVTTTQLARMASQVSETEGTTSAAAAALAELAGGNKVASESFVTVTEAALAMERVTGKAVSETIAEFSRLADDPLAAAIALDEQYNFLTKSVYEQVRALTQQGDTIGATKVITESYADTVKERAAEITRDLGFVDRAWIAIKDSAASAWDALKGVGRKGSLDDQMEEIRRQIDFVRSNPSIDIAVAGVTGPIFGPEGERKLQDYLVFLQDAKDAQADLAEYDREQLRLKNAAIAAQQQLDGALTSSASNAEKLQKRYAEIDKQVRDAAKWGITYTDAQVKQLKDAAAEQFKEREKSNAEQKKAEALAKQRAAAEQRVLDMLLPQQAAQRQYNDQIQILDARLKAGSITWQDYQDATENARKALNKLEFDKRAKEQEEHRKQVEQSAKALQGLSDRVDPASRLTREYSENQAVLNKAFESGQISGAEYARLMGLLGQEYEQNQRASSQWAKFTEGAVDRVDKAFADAWRNIGDGFSAFSTSLKDAFKQLLAELAHMAITRPIVMQFASALGIGAGTQGNNGIWGSLLGGSGGSGGGLNFGSLLQYGQTAYGALTGWGPAAMAGWQSGGLTGAVTGVGNYYGGMASGAAGTVAGWFGAGTGATQAGYTGAQYAAWVAAQNGAAGAAGAAGAGAGGLSGMLSTAASAWPLAVALGMFQSGRLYSQGVRPDAGEMWNSVQGGGPAATLGKIGNVASTLQSGFFSVLDKTLAPVVGGKIAAMLTGSTLHQAVWTAVNKKLFGGAWETKDVGIALGVNGGDLQSQQFEYQKKKGGLFSSSKKRTRFSDLDAETAAAFDQIFDQTQDNVTGLYERLGLSFQDGMLDGLNVARTQISTKGKSEEEIQQAVAEWFGTVSDAMTNALGEAFGAGFGEVNTQWLSDYVTNMEGVNEVLKTLGRTSFGTSLEAARLADHLSVVSGGFANLQTNSAAYFDAFYTDAEKQANVIRVTTEAFERANAVLPETREGFRKAVDTLDLTTVSGQQMFATLMSLAGQASSYFDVLDAQANQAKANADAITAALLGTASSSFAAIQRSIAQQQKQLTDAYNARVGSLNDMLGSSQTNLNGLTNVFGRLDSALKGLLGTSDDATAMLYEQANVTVQSALAMARRGQSVAGLDLEAALGSLTGNTTSRYSSFEDFARDQGRAANSIAELQGLTGKQLTAEQRTLETLQKQLDLAKSSYEREMAGLDAQLTFAQDQLNALNGIDDSVLSVADAIKQMNASVVAALGAIQGPSTANTPKNNRAIVDSIYQSVLGRSTAGDEGGAAFWAAALQNGTASYQDVAASIAKGALGNSAESSATKKSAEAYLKSIGVPGFASGGMHSGGVRLVGERGPELEVTGPSRIFNAGQTASMLGGSPELLAEVRSLRSEVAQLRPYLYETTKNTAKTADAVRDQNEIGVRIMAEEA